MRKKIIIATVPLALLLAACSGPSTPVGDKDGVSSLKVDVKADDQVPDVKFDTPINVKEDTVQIVKEGSGDKIAEGDRVMYRLAAVDGNTDKVVNETYTKKKDAPLIFGPQLKQQASALYEGLKDQKKGATIAFIPKAESDDQRGVMVFTITDVQKPPTYTDMAPGAQFGDKSVTDKIGVKWGADNWAPQVSIDKALNPTKAGARLYGSPKEDGAVITDDMKLSVNTAIIDIATGNQTQDTYSLDTPTKPIMADLKTEMPVLYEALKGQKVGQTVVYVPKTAQGQQATALVMTVTGAEKYHTPTLMKQDQVKKLRDEGKLPTVKEQGAKKVPAITFPKDTKAPQDLVSETIKEGTGPTVKDTDTVTVTYSGWAWDSHKNFDENFTKSPIPMSLDGVIKGWKMGLAGKKVGSTVMLVVPKDLAYGETPQGDAEGDLVFYVKIEKTAAAK
ncbi:FKBP-type peptidyl-prolyl cis-trans isomerase [Falsarthrobacter nasiphocae]|uniref:peptidylprolyl isomerase n=1 Tax=Falsarthrobacter nasiphocae TaxID=189863 RepID=A0AAE3YDD7_9MICC|nr:FKBP-type peptidyl-prolyl cis-trans isomerase [Falsarthrobacter nasiphocae]MDR6891105.1 FKBP-type peptidyl-prolyl cis-trans isomerase [Falsarthrobacter nasiphocae]